MMTYALPVIWDVRLCDAMDDGYEYVNMTGIGNANHVTKYSEVMY